METAATQHHQGDPGAAIQRAVVVALVWAIVIEIFALGWERTNRLVGHSEWTMLLEYGLFAPIVGVLTGYFVDWDIMMARYRTPRARLTVLCRDAGIAILGGLVLAAAICLHIAGTAIAPIALIYAAVISISLSLVEHATPFTSGARPLGCADAHRPSGLAG